MTEPGGTDVIPALIQGLVDFMPEVEAAKKVIEQNDKKRAMLRDTLIEAGVLESIDEISGYKAVLVHQEKDVYIAEKLVPLLPRPEMANDVIQTVVDAAEVQKIVNGGMLTRAELLRTGALVRMPKTRPFIKLEPLKGRR